MLMKIAYDAKRLFHNKSGLGNYSRTLVSNYRSNFTADHISLLSPKIEGSSFLSQFLDQDYNLIEGKNNVLWRFKGIMKELKSGDFDVYHGLSNELPHGIQKCSNLKKIVTIHDLIFLQFPQFYPFIDRKIYEEKFERSCKKADSIIAVSQATKDDIIRFFKIDPSKIEVVYQTCHPQYYKIGETVDKIAIHKKINRPYGLFVSTISERKNLLNVLKAMTTIKEPDRPLLLVVGEGKKYKSKMEAWVDEHGLKSDVSFLGHISDEALLSLYFHAHWSIYPSFYEGYGIPVVESLLCGTPTITSNTSSMPEAGHQLADLIDPHSTLEIQNAISKYTLSRKRIRKNSIQKVRELTSSDQISEQIHRIYREK